MRDNQGVQHPYSGEPLFPGQVKVYSGPATRKKSLSERILDRVRGGAYTSEPSEHNRQLYERERTVLLRWRIIGAVNLASLILLTPVTILVYGLRTYVQDIGGAVGEDWRRITKGTLY